MKVYVKPIPQSLSQAMWRVARALEHYAPEGIEFINQPGLADLQVIHAISPDAGDVIAADRYAVIQYCVNSAEPWHTNWMKLWKEADLVWSYYDLGFLDNFYLSPLGIDKIFRTGTVPSLASREGGVLTSGYVHGPGAEAIEEVAIAASLAGMPTKHLGPKPQNMTQFPRGWSCAHGIMDTELRNLYDSCHFVSGLRYIEGFEMPAIEGLARGCTPIVFDRDDMRRWYDGIAEFVPECSGNELVGHLLPIFQRGPQPWNAVTQGLVLERFNWATIIDGFWSRVREAVSA